MTRSQLLHVTYKLLCLRFAVWVMGGSGFGLGVVNVLGLDLDAPRVGALGRGCLIK